MADGGTHITRHVLPLCSADDIRAELADTDASLMRLAGAHTIDADRRNERRAILTRWKHRLQEQLNDMEATT